MLLPLLLLRCPAEADDTVAADRWWFGGEGDERRRRRRLHGRARPSIPGGDTPRLPLPSANEDEDEDEDEDADEVGDGRCPRPPRVLGAGAALAAATSSSKLWPRGAAAATTGVHLRRRCDQDSPHALR